MDLSTSSELIMRPNITSPFAEPIAASRQRIVRYSRARSRTDQLIGSGSTDASKTMNAFGFPSGPVTRLASAMRSVELAVAAVPNLTRGS